MWTQELADLFNPAWQDFWEGDPNPIADSGSVLGTNRSDSIEASETTDFVFGFDGNDLIYGLGFSDDLYGEDRAQRDINELIPDPDDCDPSRPNFTVMASNDIIFGDEGNKDDNLFSASLG